MDNFNLKTTESEKAIILTYHEQTKHHLGRFARGPEYIDWDAQPDSFRRFIGTESTELPLTARQLTVAFAQLYQPTSRVPQSLDLNSIANLLELSLGISAWKQYGSASWALRCNPSSGNLHPTECYLILPTIAEFSQGGIYHYLSYNHCLEHRGILTADQSQTLTNWLPADSFLCGLTSIPWREAWKYGERAFRYCQHDLGHAIAAIRYAAGALGWQVQLLTQWGDADISQSLGLHRQEDFQDNEPEIPEAMLLISRSAVDLTTLNQQRSAITTLLEQAQWAGKANVLDENHLYQWDSINAAVAATHKPATEDIPWQPSDDSPLQPLADASLTATQIILQRRSAQMFDGKTELSLANFYRLLDCTLPRKNGLPWDSFPYPPHLNLILFIHRVENLAPGLYILVRRQDPEMQQAIARPEFDWKIPPQCPAHLQFYHLVTADSQNVARQISCHQHIASHSAFSLGMLGALSASLEAGAWGYRRLFWEAGMIGQVLYLEAEAAGVRGTGIGCFFDDAFHNLLGLEYLTYQSIYHFTVGTALIDERLQTLPPYAHLSR